MASKWRFDTNKPEQILRLEKHYNITLKQIAIEGIMEWDNRNNKLHYLYHIQAIAM